MLHLVGDRFRCVQTILQIAEMCYCFRYRVKLIKPISIDDGSLKILRVPGFPEITVCTDNEAFPVGKWTTFTACGFASEEAARRAGEQFGEILLVAGALENLGIDLGTSRSTLQFSAAIHEAISRESGKEFRAEVHGLMTFEKDTVAIIGFSGRGLVSVSIGEFRERIAK